MPYVDRERISPLLLGLFPRGEDAAPNRWKARAQAPMPPRRGLLLVLKRSVRTLLADEVATVVELELV